MKKLLSAPDLTARHFAVLTIASCAVLILMTLHAAFAQTPSARLRPVITVEHDVVRLGDIFEGAGSKADIAVFGAPAPGASGMISSARILSAARDHGLADIETNGLSSVAVRRVGRKVMADEISRAITEALATQHQLPRDLEIELNSGQMEVVVESAATDPVSIRSLFYNGGSGRFEATFVVPGSRAMEINPAKVVGNVSDIVRVPVLNKAVLKGDTITAADLTLERRRRSEIGAEIVTDAVRIVSNAVRRPMPKGSLVRDGDVQRPELIERNATVLMTFEHPGMQLSMRGKALQAGSLGDTIQVQNMNSKKTVEAIITGPNKAAVTGAVLSQPKVARVDQARN